MSRDLGDRLGEDDRGRDTPDLTPGPKPDPQHGGPDGTEEGVTAEAKLFLRMAVFGIVVGTVYWFLTYETAGSVMLTAFGAASGLAALAIWFGSRNRPGRGRRPVTPVESASAAGAVQVSHPGWAPIGIAIGLGGLALAGAFGPWLGIAGVFLALRSAKGWLDAQMDEADAVAAGEGGAKRN